MRLGMIRCDAGQTGGEGRGLVGQTGGEGRGWGGQTGGVVGQGFRRLL